MIIEIECVNGDKRLVGNSMTFDALKTAVREIFEICDEESFVPAFCSRYGYKELPYSEGYAAYWIDLDTRCVLVTSYTFPKELDGAKILYYTDRGTFDPVYYVGGAIAHNVVYLAICKYDNDDAYYVFHCDESLEVVADDSFESKETCKAVMDKYNVEWHEQKETK